MAWGVAKCPKGLSKSPWSRQPAVVGKAYEALGIFLPLVGELWQGAGVPPRGARVQISSRTIEGVEILGDPVEVVAGTGKAEGQRHLCWLCSFPGAGKQLKEHEGSQELSELTPSHSNL